MADGPFDNAADKMAAEKALADERQKDFTRRALLRAGWIVPVISTVLVPAASAQATPPPHNDAHGDAPHADHGDAPHADHGDTAPPHSDAPHVDGAAVVDSSHQNRELHLDVRHIDGHGDSV